MWIASLFSISNVFIIFNDFLVLPHYSSYANNNFINGNSNSNQLTDNQNNSYHYNNWIMELSPHSLTLNEDTYNQISEQKRPIFVFEWLRFLDKVLVNANKADIKGCQKKLVEQLTAQM